MISDDLDSFINVCRSAIKAFQMKVVAYAVKALKMIWDFTIVAFQFISEFCDFIIIHNKVLIVVVLVTLE